VKIICQIFRSPRKQEMYLYVEKSRGLVDVPEVLLKQFGEPEARMVLVLTTEKKLARASSAEVMQQITDYGYYLQMPPTTAELLKRDGNEL
jgi:uncharacterized protein YcgL (UPF0745 family)